LAVSFIGGETRVGTQIKPLTCQKSLTNLIIKYTSAWAGIKLSLFSDIDLNNIQQYLFRDLITSKTALLLSIFGIEIQPQLYYLGSIFGTVIHCSARQFYILSIFGIEIQVQLYFVIHI
jgi:hypothetical protein